MNKNDLKSILLVEDDELFRDSINEYLCEKYKILPAESAEEGLRILKDKVPSLVLLDITLPGMSGVEMIEKIKKNSPDLPVIILSAIDRIPKVVEIMKLGAVDYLVKPVMSEVLLVSIERILESSETKIELEQRRKLQLSRNKEYKLIGNSEDTKKIKREIKTVCKTDVTILIQGESGTGKELVAREIHGCSSRASGPFVAINCGAIPKDLIESELFGYKKGAFTGAQSEEIGKFRLANLGTLLLDEIGELSMEAQTKLLRVLEEKEFYPVGSTELVKVDVRVVASTNKNLKKMVKEGSFRADLFYRLNVYSIFIPPLRKRPQDILCLTEFFIERFNVKFGKNFQKINPDAKKLLLDYPWEGNVRELRNLVERVILSEDGVAIEKKHLYFIESFLKEDNSIPPQKKSSDRKKVGGDSPVHQTLSKREFQVMCMIATGNSVKEIAEELSLSMNTVGTNRTRILKKMDLRNNAEIAYYAVKFNLVE